MGTCWIVDPRWVWVSLVLHPPRFVGTDLACTRGFVMGGFLLNSSRTRPGFFPSLGS
jgi:hypothetical protein